jgi:hypothetical protein
MEMLGGIWAKSHRSLERAADYEADEVAVSSHGHTGQVT